MIFFKVWLSCPCDSAFCLCSFAIHLAYAFFFFLNKHEGGKDLKKFRSTTVNLLKTHRETQRQGTYLLLFLESNSTNWEQ